eukprot:364484-Chlamydomonas_euryale.AAC.3
MANDTVGQPTRAGSVWMATAGALPQRRSHASITLGRLLPLGGGIKACNAEHKFYLQSCSGWPLFSHT